MDINMRTAAVVHTDRLKHNITLLREKYLVPGAELTAVLKGDAYGCGIENGYPVLKELGVRRFAVAVWEEGRKLRELGADTEEILILGDTYPGDREQLFRYGLTPTVFCIKTAEELSALAESLKGKDGCAYPLPVNIKVDTGMSRIGFPAGEEAAEAAAFISKLPGLEISGMFTHFANADEELSLFTEKQLKDFLKTAKLAEQLGAKIPVLHTANSPASLLHPETHLDAVRAGDVIFGLCPVDPKLWNAMDFEEVITWQTYAAMVKTVPAGTPVGYGSTFVTDKETVIATIPVGFADGYRRQLSNKGCVYINGYRATIIGRVCMDQFMVDATEVPGIKPGDTVELLGEHFGILDMALLLDINVDEVVTGISKRVPRVTSD